MKKLLFAIMACALCLGLVGGAFAYFTDTATSETNSFTAGTLSIEDGGITSFDFDVGNMAPGDVTDEQVIIIENDGSLPLFWFGGWTISGGDILNQAIYIDYAKMEFLPSVTTPWEPEDIFITDGLGSGTWGAPYTTMAGGNTFNLVGLDVWDDNNIMGTTPYEHVGALNPGYRYRLTVKFGFAADADDTYQGLGPLNVSITVNAIQANQTQLTDFGYPAMWSWLNTQLAKQP